MSAKNNVVKHQLTEMQQDFIHNLVRLGMNPTAAAREAGYSVPKMSAHDLTRSPRVAAAIRLARQTFYNTDLASLAGSTLRQIMEDSDAPAAARVTAARTALELAGDLDRSKGSDQAGRNLAELSPEELSKMISSWEDEKMKLAKDVTPQDQGGSVAAAAS
ncbi:MAG: hypothetical protein ACPHKR_01895 [bacterium]